MLNLGCLDIFFYKNSPNLGDPIDFKNIFLIYHRNFLVIITTSWAMIFWTQKLCRYRLFTHFSLRFHIVSFRFDESGESQYFQSFWGSLMDQYKCPLKSTSKIQECSIKYQKMFIKCLLRKCNKFPNSILYAWSIWNLHFNTKKHKLP